MHCRLGILYAACALTTLAGLAQTQDAPVGFEVVSIKPPGKPGTVYFQRGCTGSRFVYAGSTLARLVLWVYDLPLNRIQGLPTWTTESDAEYQIEAKAPLALSESQCKSAVQALLADRFRMAAHLDQKEMRAYALTVAKKGPRLRRVDPATPYDRGGVRLNGIPFRFSPLEAPGGITMAQLANRLSAVPALGFPVVDKTGLSGIYSFSLSFSIREDDGLPPIMSAVEQQLGLKLESTKALVDILVVAHIERPTPN
jgi:uncharacterized protein (TIGR03435 family)